MICIASLLSACGANDIASSDVMSEQTTSEESITNDDEDYAVPAEQDIESEAPKQEDGESKNEERDSSEDTPDGYDVVGGTWKVRGVYIKGHLIDTTDVEAIESMYETIMVTFNDDGSFVYLQKIINDRGIWSRINGGSQESFMLKTESTFKYDLVNGSLQEKETETTNHKQYVVSFLDETTFSLNEYDAITGKAKANEDPYIFVKQGEESEYLAQNKTPINDNGSSKPSTNQETSQNNDPDNAKATSGEKNALSKANDYLAYTAFSHDGLVEQLKYEGFSQSEAQYGADNCGADWKEQAAKKAKDYLSYTAFSYNGLIEQLEYEGFTNAEAQYGADNCGANWKEQAAEKARQYLEYSTFSRSELIDQLVFEGFTQEQAEYGVNKVY